MPGETRASIASATLLTDRLAAMTVRCHGQGGAAVDFVSGGEPVYGNQNAHWPGVPFLTEGKAQASSCCLLLSISAPSTSKSTASIVISSQ
jgi:hypothetical protein